MAELVLNGSKTTLASQEGRDFISDATRAGEGLLADSDLRQKYEINDADWQAITTNAAVARAVRAESERRVRTGVAAQEMAAKHFTKAPNYLNELMIDPKTHPKFRIESARELKNVAIGNGNEAAANAAERFVININLGSRREHYEFPMKQVRSTTEDWGWDEVNNDE
jgi:hypothetical protein